MFFPCAQISGLDEHNFLSIADRSAFVWNVSEDCWSSTFGGTTSLSSSALSSGSISNRFGGTGLSSGVSAGDLNGIGASSSNFEMQKLFTIRNTPDGSIPLSSSTVMLHTFEQNTSSSTGMDIGIPSKPLNVLYCVCGHKMYAGRIPSVDTSLKSNMTMSGSAAPMREVSVYLSI